MSYVVFSVHVIPFVQQQFQTLTGILLGSIMGSSHAKLYKNEEEAVMMIMMTMMMGRGEEGRDNTVCLCYVCVKGRRERDKIDSFKCKSVYKILVVKTK